MKCVEKEFYSKVINDEQYLLSPMRMFTMTPLNIDYPNGAPICIEDIDLKYDCLGFTLPLGFYLCGSSGTFEIDYGKQCACSCINVINSIPSAFQDQINATIALANSTIQTGQSVSGAASVVEKTQNAANAVEQASNTAVSAAQTVNNFINTTFPAPAANTLEASLTNLGTATLNLANAQQIAAPLADQTSLTPAQADLIVAQLNLSINNIIQAVTPFITGALTPAPSQAAVDYATKSLNDANIASGLITNLDNSTSPTWADVSTAILNTYVAGLYAADALIIAAQTNGNSTVQELATSLLNVLYAVFLADFAGSNLNNSLNLTGSSQISALNSAGRYSITSARYSILAVSFSNNQTRTLVPLYRDFKTSISNVPCCNIKCCLNSCDKNFKSALFYQPVTTLHICNLTISVRGTIGYQCFTAQLSYPNLTSLETLEFQPIILDETICIPKNICSFILKEQFLPQYEIQCIYPTTNYNSNNPLTFSADIFSKLKLKTLLSASIIQSTNHQ